MGRAGRGYAVSLARRMATPSRGKGMVALSGEDHSDLFNKNGRPHVFTFQPYGLRWDTVRALVAKCTELGLALDILTWPAWHYPGAVLFCTVRRDETQIEGGKNA